MTTIDSTGRIAAFRAAAIPLHRTGLHRHIAAVRRLRRIAHHSIVRQIPDTSTLPLLNKSSFDCEVERYLETAPGA
jgi:hypothetical protein